MTNGRNLIAVLSVAVLLLSVGAGVAFAGKPLGLEYQINGEPPEERDAAVAYNPDRKEYLVVWWNDRPGNDDIYGRRLAWDGNLVGPRFSIAAGTGADRRYPDVAYNSQTKEYLVVWEHFIPAANFLPSHYTIKGQRVSGTGQPVGSEIDIGPPQGVTIGYSPAVACAADGDPYVVVWESHTSGSISNDIVGRTVSSQGAPGTTQTVAQGTWPATHGRPDLAFNRSRNEFLAVWEQDDKSGASGAIDIYGRRIRGDGVPMGADPFLIDNEGWDLTNPAVAAIPTVPNEGQYLVVWEFNWPADVDLWARRIKGDGTLLGPVDFNIAAGSVPETIPAVAGHENIDTYLVAWTEPMGAATGVRAQEVALDETLLGGSPWLGGDNADRTAIAAGGLADFLIAWDAIPNPSNQRDIWGRLWGNRLYLPMVLRNK